MATIIVDKDGKEYVIKEKKDHSGLKKFFLKAGEIAAGAAVTIGTGVATGVIVNKMVNKK